MLDDAVDLAIRDQERAGIDVVSDGEMRRAGFFTAEFYRHLTGVRTLPPDRRLGAGGHDGSHRFEVDEPIAAPNGLGVVDEFLAARDADGAAAQGDAARAVHAVGPARHTVPARSTRRGSRLRRRSCRSSGTELRALVDAGATIIQIDEPSPAIHPDARADFAALFNAAIEPVVGAGPARRPPLLRQLPRPAARAALVPTDPRRDARLRTSTSSSSSSPTAR